jgi:hypothetical protein
MDDIFLALKYCSSRAAVVPVPVFCRDLSCCCHTSTLCTSVHSGIEKKMGVERSNRTCLDGVKDSNVRRTFERSISNFGVLL